ncbi:MAG: molecular chaperone DnaJ [Candidatus Doudnabacteria bacterium]|nr:molecular chaperone DnaJ [Candidatus Doudnabacteria bacterium]
MTKDFYQSLGVPKGASQEEIKRAFRKKAHEFHPDKGNGNADKFKEINEAYQVLGDDQKRKAYDTYGSNWEAASQARASNGQSPFEGFDFSGGSGSWGFGDDLGDIFSDFFGGRQEATSRRNRGIDLEMSLSIAFEEAVFGVEKTVTLEKKDTCIVCEGSGASEGSKLITCAICKGSGQVVAARRTIFGTVQSRTVCERCEGTGKVPEIACQACGGNGLKRQDKTISVKIPAGIDNGQRVRVMGEGEAGYRGSSPGDLYLFINVKPSKEFTRDGFNLHKDLPISFTQAALGAKILVKTLDGDIELKVPSGTQSATVFKVKEKGVPYVNAERRGDLLLTARVIVPQKLSKKEKELLKKLADERGEVVEVDKGFWESIKGNL